MIEKIRKIDIHDLEHINAILNQMANGAFIFLRIIVSIVIIIAIIYVLYCLINSGIIPDMTGYLHGMKNVGHMVKVVRSPLVA